MVSVVVIISIIVMIIPSPREQDHTFSGIIEGACGMGIGSHLQVPSLAPGS